MKHVVIIIVALFSISSFAQDKKEEQILAHQKANDLVYDANILADNEDYVSAEMEYRKAMSEQPNYTVGAYNLGNSYYKKGIFDEALYRLKQTAKHATTRDEKYRAFHNIGNILMQDKQCKAAAEAFKNALRNNPTDNETRYNYALAKECAEQQQEEQDKQDENKDQNEDNKDQEKDQKDQDQDKEDKKDQEDENKDEEPKDDGEKDKKEGEDKKDEEGNPKDEKEDEGKGGEDEKKEQPKPQPGQLSPQQVKNLLEAMNDQEQKVQDKMNAQKTKGERVQTEKDW
jgi:tetratricopeptide (TPR) repeat protein